MIIDEATQSTMM